jgi:hypothetical protein
MRRPGAVRTTRLAICGRPRRPEGAARRHPNETTSTSRPREPVREPARTKPKADIRASPCGSWSRWLKRDKGAGDRDARRIDSSPRPPYVLPVRSPPVPGCVSLPRTPHRHGEKRGRADRLGQGGGRVGCRRRGPRRSRAQAPHRPGERDARPGRWCRVPRSPGGVPSTDRRGGAAVARDPPSAPARPPTMPEPRVSAQRETRAICPSPACPPHARPMPARPDRWPRRDPSAARDGMRCS